MTLHELPDDVEALHGAPEGIVVAVVATAVDNLLPSLTAGPEHTAPSLHPVHGGVVVGALGLAVQAGHQVPEVGRLLQEVIPATGDHCAVRPLAQVAGGLGRVGHRVVQVAVEVDDVEGRVWPGCR